jgi:hypothetical protein
MKRECRVWFVLLPAALLLLAHVSALVALLSFGRRTGGYPLDAAGLVAYGLAAAAAAALLGLGVLRIVRSGGATPGMLPVAAPAIAVFVLLGGLWLPELLGGGTYPPYDPRDPDIRIMFGLLFAVPACLIAITYGSYRYLAAGCAIHAAVYWSAYSIPAYLHYPDVGLLAALLDERLTVLLGVYAMGGLLVLARLTRFGRDAKGPIWVGAALAGLAGGWGLHWILTWLPENGDNLGYVAFGHFVPENGWDWSRAAATALAVAAMVAAALVGPALVVIDRLRYRENATGMTRPGDGASRTAAG